MERTVYLTRFSDFGGGFFVDKVHRWTSLRQASTFPIRQYLMERQTKPKHIYWRLMSFQEISISFKPVISQAHYKMFFHSKPQYKLSSPTTTVHTFLLLRTSVICGRDYKCQCRVPHPNPLAPATQAHMQSLIDMTGHSLGRPLGRQEQDPRRKWVAC